MAERPVVYIYILRIYFWTLLHIPKWVLIYLVIIEWWTLPNIPPHQILVSIMVQLRSGPFELCMLDFEWVWMCLLCVLKRRVDHTKYLLWLVGCKGSKCIILSLDVAIHQTEWSKRTDTTNPKFIETRRLLLLLLYAFWIFRLFWTLGVCHLLAFPYLDYL